MACAGTAGKNRQDKGTVQTKESFGRAELIMKYSCFTKEVRERLQNVLGAGYHVSIQKLRRNNGIKTD